MQKYSQKWSLVAFIEPTEEDDEFHFREWPLHISLASVFAIDIKQTLLLDKLSSILQSIQPITVTTNGEDFWGPNQEYHVTLLEKKSEIMNLHNVIHQLLIDNGAVFNEPQYEGNGFIPHCTVQQHKHLAVGSQAIIKSLALIDMFPNADGERRKIAKVIQLSN